MASSPAPSASGAEASKKIAFRFCPDCSNMLNAVEDHSSRQLVFKCRTCNYMGDADSLCVYRNELSNTVGETAGITQDVGQDPTVCDGNNVDDVVVVGGGGESEEAVPDLCTLCGQTIACAVCGEEVVDGQWVSVEGDMKQQQPQQQRGNPTHAQEKDFRK